MGVLYRDLTFSSGVTTTVDDRGWITATARMEFNVFVSSPLDTESTVINFSGVPANKSQHPYFPYLFCDSRDCTRQGPRHFVVVCTFKSAPYKDTPTGPLNEPTQISYYTIGTEGACEEDIDGKPIVTRCGEIIYGVTRTFSDLGIRLTKNFASFDPPSFYLFINTVNSDTFLGFPPGTLWIASIAADEQFFEEVPYWKVTVEIHARKPYRTTNEKAWYVRYRHQGFRSFQDVGGTRIVGKVLRQGEPVTSPVLLDEQGYEIPEDTTNLSDPTAVWLESKIYETRSFADMGF